MDLTQYQRVADALLQATEGTTLRTFVSERAALGVPAERIARQLAEATGGAVNVTGAAVRNWVRQFRESQAVAS